MIKQLFLSAAIGLSAAAGLAADRTDVIEYFNCDFTNGFPEGVTLEDADGATLHFLMIQAGFDQGDSWKVFHDRSSGNYYAASPSMHTVAAGESPVAANDRMTLPPILVRGSQALLTWRCRAINDQSATSSTYSILINDETILKSAEAPASGWISMDLSLEEYVGKRISITFVNTTLNGEVLAIDDIAISGQPGVATITTVPGSYALGGESFRIGATFTASADIPVTSVGLTCEVGGQILTAESNGLNLQRGESTTLLIDREFDLDFGSELSYVITPTVNGITYDPQACTTTPLAFLPHKRVVIEEGTGMWCGWCPLGIVATDSLKMQFGSDVIPIAIHFGDDLMAMDSYAAAIGISGAPYGKFDRVTETADPMTLLKDGRKESYTIWRGGFGTLAQQRLAINTMAEITAEAALSADKKNADITCTVRFAVNVDKADYRIALVMVEDKVWEENSFQNNYLSRYAERAPMGGFESLPGTILSDFEYDHVARAVANNAYTGIKGSLPNSFIAGQPCEFVHRMQVPSKVVNTANTQVVAMLIDGSDGSIVNACAIPLDQSGINHAVADSAETISIGRGHVTITRADKADFTASLFDLSGRLVASGSTSTGTLTLSAPRGFYVVRTAAGSKAVAL